MRQLVLPGFLAAACLGTSALERAGVSAAFIPTLVVGALAVIAVVVERVWPARAEFLSLDQPLLVDGSHFLFNYNLGYLIAFVALGRVPSIASWPAGWPFALQVLLAAVLAEALAYWQHRLYHRVGWLWPFHALHHAGPRLNLLRAARFHFVDIGPGVFLTFLPLVLLGAPTSILTWAAVVTGVLGVVQHANVAAPTPAWLDGIICTPAVHRTHHSLEPAESDANFGTVVMIFDRLFGTWIPPRPLGPDRMGIAEDPLPRGFWRQLLGPFRGRPQGEPRRPK